MLATITEMNRLKPKGIKFHLLHVLKGTILYRQYLKKQFSLLNQDEYAELIAFLLEHLDPDIVIHRLTAEREREIFYAPEWALNKQAVLKSIKLKMQKAGTFQGRRYIPPAK
jgi:radical SAM superfamily enzyme